MARPAVSRQQPRRFNWYLWERFIRRPSVNGYSREVNNLDELPDTARKAVVQQLAPGEKPLQIIFAPYQTVLGDQPVVKVRGIRFLPWEYTRDRVIVLTGRNLLAVDLDENEQVADIFCAPLDQMLYLQSGKILLFSWMEWVWAEGSQVRRLRCYFNTVCERMYGNLAEAVRCSIPSTGPQAPLDDGRGINLLNGLSYKFRNMLPLYLLDDESIEQMLFRPSRWDKRAWLWKVHVLSKAVLLLTNLHLLLAEEELTRDEDAYGLIVTYLPRGRILRLALLTEGEDVRLSILVALGEAKVTLNLLAQAELRPQLEALSQAFER